MSFIHPSISLFFLPPTLVQKYEQILITMIGLSLKGLYYYVVALPKNDIFSVFRGLDNYLHVKQVTQYVSDEPWGWYKSPSKL